MGTGTTTPIIMLLTFFKALIPCQALGKHELLNPHNILIR